MRISNFGIGVLHVKVKYWRIFVTSFLCSLQVLLFHRVEYPKRCLWTVLWLSCCDMTVPSKSNVPSMWPWPLIYEGHFCQWIEYNPISILYTFQIDISSNSREIKYPNIGRTHRHIDTHTDRQTGWKQYLATPSGGEVIRKTKHGRVWCTLPDNPFNKPNISLITDSVKIL